MVRFRLLKRLFRLIGEGASFAINALLVSRLRSLLSLLGITIGIFLIISVFTLVDSLERSIQKSFESLGDDSVFIEKMPWGPESEGEYAWWKYIQRPDVSLKETQQLGERMNSSRAVTFIASSRRNLENGGNTAENASVVAVTEGFENFFAVDIGVGRNFTGRELKSSARICILGSNVADRLSKGTNLVGSEIKIAGFTARVIGILEKEGSGPLGSGTDEWAIVPVRFGSQVMRIDRSRTQIGLKPKAGVTVAEMENEVQMNMRSIRKLRPGEERNFAVNKSSMINQGLEQLFGLLNVAGLIIGGFSILVGGFSIANIMFVSVRERTNIIGIQKALGAKRSFILYQFLFEAVALCVFGGLIGLLIIYVAASAVSFFTDFELVLTLKNIVIGIGFSAVIGLVSGVIPALMAARMEPVEAMRSNA